MNATWSALQGLRARQDLLAIKQPSVTGCGELAADPAAAAAGMLSARTPQCSARDGDGVRNKPACNARRLFEFALGYVIDVLPNPQNMPKMTG
jgi:hypothetical protein